MFIAIFMTELLLVLFENIFVRSSNTIQYLFCFRAGGSGRLSAIRPHRSASRAQRRRDDIYQPERKHHLNVETFNLKGLAPPAARSRHGAS